MLQAEKLHCFYRAQDQHARAEQGYSRPDVHALEGRDSNNRRAFPFLNLVVHCAAVPRANKSSTLCSALIVGSGGQTQQRFKDCWTVESLPIEARPELCVECEF